MQDLAVDKKTTSEWILGK